jgi:hypothetical protein
MSPLFRQPTGSAPGPLSVAAAMVQVVVTILAGILGLLVSAAFCDGSGYCGVRGLRWVLWVGCCCALVAASCVTLRLALSQGLRAPTRRALLAAESAFTLVAVVMAVLALRSIVASFVGLVAVAESLGIVVVVAAANRDGPVNREPRTRV